MGDKGTKAMTDSLAKLDVLGIFDNNSEVNNPEGPYDGNGYDKTLNIQEEDINPDSDFVFVLNPSGDDYTVVQYTNTEDTSPVIPSEYNNKPVVAIGDDALYINVDQNGGTGSVLMTSETTPSLLGMTRLTDTNSLTLSAFSGSRERLVSVAIPNTIESIGNRAFANNALTSIIIPDSVKTIGDGAFASNQLTALVLPDSILTVGTYAFESNRITEVTLSNSLTALAADVFANNLLVEVNIPDSVTVIENGAFRNNALESAVIPSGVTYLGGSVFLNNVLTGVTFEGSKPTHMGEQIFAGNAQLTDGTIVVPSNELSSYISSTSQMGLSMSSVYIDPNLVNPEEDFTFMWEPNIKGWAITGYVNTTDKDIIIPATRADGNKIVYI